MERLSATLHENLPIIEVDDPLLLDGLCADERAAQLLLTRLSDRVAVIAPGQFDAFFARLRRLGHTPKVLV